MMIIDLIDIIDFAGMVILSADSVVGHVNSGLMVSYSVILQCKIGGHLMNTKRQKVNACL